MTDATQPTRLFEDSGVPRIPAPEFWLCQLCGWHATSHDWQTAMSQWGDHMRASHPAAWSTALDRLWNPVKLAALVPHVGEDNQCD